MHLCVCVCVCVSVCARTRARLYILYSAVFLKLQKQITSDTEFNIGIT